MKITNLSAEPIGKLHSWIPQGLEAEQIVFLPDSCPGKSPLPTGTAVLTKQTNWRQYALSDCGCGMRLLQSTVELRDLTLARWNKLANQLRANKGRLGDLGGGNHFLDAILPYSNGPLRFLIHTGSRDESGLVNQWINSPHQFDAEFNRVVNWAEENRHTIQKEIETVFGKTELVLDKAHNTYSEEKDGGTIIRKGAVQLRPGEITIIPSHMSGDMVVVKGKETLRDILYSMSHGTGRTMSRSQCKPLAETFNFEALRKNLLIPDGVENSSLRTEGPYAYRNLDDCLSLIENYVEEIERFGVIAYMGHL